MTHPNILIIATSAATMTNGEQTGVWLEELTTPYYAFLDGGASVTVASMSGGKIPVDKRSVSKPGDNDASVERYLDDVTAQAAFNDTPRFTDLNTDAYDVVFMPGGHGTMFDYPDSPELARLIESFDKGGKIVSAVCHGPAALVSAKAEDGSPFVKGRKVAAFTDTEEVAVGLDDAVPFLLETRLRDLGAHHEAAPDFQPFAVRDGNLITGQNPASATKTAALILDALATQTAT